MTAQAIDFTSGLTAMGFLTSALFFLRFWTRARDGLFLAFAAAFALLALEQGVGTWFNAIREEQGWVYLLRLAAFLVIIVSVIRKNREAPR
ncbi:hypothetical protein SLNSH_20715 [Alsobacter soli]|uniref:Uncharacterized protein n=1 Tax=Alsobacter soli TaxID=2109933 RepID=A0A2T1HN36_9HYPH|nr:DUF5985 family protein [Alsobacter soli]PSC03052.1 hypothetical protein SLNSH_20715 [Alsobacter soli]